MRIYIKFTAVNFSFLQIDNLPSIGVNYKKLLRQMKAVKVCCLDSMAKTDVILQTWQILQK